MGYSYGPVGWYSGGWGWDDGWYASSYEAPVPVWGVSAPVGSASYAANGALLGGIAGAIIGHQDGHAGRGALIGTGAGLLLGAIADSTQRRSEAVPPYQAPPRVYAPAPVSVVPPGPAPAEADYSAPALQPQATRPASRMAEANALFGR